MPTYEERNELIKALSNQAYFDALNKPKAPNKAIQDVGVDGQTGRSLLSHPDGGLSSNGVKRFNTAAPQDGFVAARIDRNSNAIAIDGRQRKDGDRVRLLEDAALVIPIKYLQFRGQTGDINDYSELYIGGDRETPELIFSQVKDYTAVSAKLTTLESEENDWILQVVSIKTAVYTGGSLYSIWVANPMLLIEGVLLQTITPDKTINKYVDIYSPLPWASAVYTGQTFDIFFNLSEIVTGIVTTVGVVTVHDTYSATSTPSLWTYALTSRVVTTQQYNGGGSNPDNVTTVMDNIKTILEGISTNAISWKTLSDTGIAGAYGYLTVATYFAVPEYEEAQLKGGGFYYTTDYTMSNGWWFAKKGLYSKLPQSWLGMIASFDTPSSNANGIIWDMLTFTSNTQIIDQTIPASKKNNAIASLSTASIQFSQSSRNITNIAVPSPNGGTYNDLDFIQGWNQETQLIKTGNGEWRLYLKDGTSSVVKIPTFNTLVGGTGVGSSFIGTGVAKPNLDLVGDALFLNVLADTREEGGYTFLVIAGATLVSDTAKNITVFKRLPCYQKDLSLGSTLLYVSMYLTIDEYNALDDYVFS